MYKKRQEQADEASCSQEKLDGHPQNISLACILYEEYAKQVLVRLIWDSNRIAPIPHQGWDRQVTSVHLGAGLLANISIPVYPLHQDRGRQVKPVVNGAELMAILGISLACILYKECVKQVIHIRDNVCLMCDPKV